VDSDTDDDEERTVKTKKGPAASSQEIRRMMK
jgi:hypothetical protein